MLACNGLMFLNELNKYFKIFLILIFLKILFIYFQREGKGGRKRRRETSISLPLARPQLGAWPATQACALTRNWTSNLLVHRPVLSPLRHTS